ncbi:NCK-interacting protein with SH3 domain-like [Asterias amurensis]|uniref:NCK-interacting protein with SH3 domain-like n=1 Tax=Asterias amurensis TaxID=7602 RepID=UPI003AB87A8E
MSYQALYTYRSSEKGTLCFEEGDKFTLLDSVDPYWWQVTDARGQVGFVPANYIEQLRDNKQDVLVSIDRAIEFIHLSATQKGGSLTHEQRNTLQKLVEHRETVFKQQQNSSSDSSTSSKKITRSSSRSSGKHRAAPPPPIRAEDTPKSPNTVAAARSPVTRTNSQIAETISSPAKDGNPEPQSPNTVSVARSPITKTNSQAAKNVSSPAKDRSSMSLEERLSSPAKVQSLSTESVPSKLGEELVELVRVRTGLSYAKSMNALSAVFSHIVDSVPAVGDTMEQIMQSLQGMSNSSVSNGSLSIEGSKDMERLMVIFSELTDCKNDSQQRSWALHEDEAVISEYLEELSSILSDANPDVCKAVIQRDNYEVINSLILYYQMEMRTSLRLLLLKVFGVLCGLEAVIASQLLYSVLLVEIARDMQTDAQCIQKVCFSALVATMLLSSGQPLMYTHYDQLNEDFVRFLLNNIEDPPPEDESEQLPDLFVNLVLAFNLHFTEPSENLVMRVLGKRKTSKTFSEKIMVLFNREVDPVRMFEHEPKPPNSLLKFLCDIFANADTSSLFYTNDMNVLIDIIIRQLTDRCPGDKQRTEYLGVIHSILRMPVYWEQKHRLADLRRVIEKIAKEEEPESKPDKEVLMQIRKECQLNFTITF